MIGRKVLIVLLLVLALLVLTAWINPQPTWIKDVRRKLPVHPDRKYNRRILSTIEQVIIHHSTGPTTQTPSSIAQYHVGPNHISNEGIPGIAYHYIIDREANVFHTQDLENISWHVSGQNTRSIGICFIGDYDELEPTEMQILQLLRLIQYLNRRLGRRLQIAGHRDYSTKTCPGKYTNLDQVRQKLNY